ncbi:MAG: TetR/AcrR family transcriptional regulator [Chloroflexota bacterium]|jgi:AcrR family transcriptional regulator
MSPTFFANRRQKRIAARQAQILDAAAVIFSRKGYERATTREIAELADVSEGTLYNYFAGKQALLEGVAQDYAEQVAAEIATIDAADVTDMMSQLLTRRFQNGRERRLFMVFLYEARLNSDQHQPYIHDTLSQIITAIEDRLTALVSAGVMRPVDTAIAARMISATVMGFASLFEIGGQNRDDQLPGEKFRFAPEALGEEMTDIFLYGLLEQSGEAAE